MENRQGRKIVIVGGVAGGATAAARLRRLDERAEIIMLEKGEYISFANCGLPYYVGGVIEDRDDLTLQTPESFKARFNVDVRVSSEAVSIETGKKTVRVRDVKKGGEYDLPYDSLILSPGAEPVKPNIPGLSCGRVFTLRNIPDTYRIKDFIDSEKPDTAVVMGGGFIGVEMAENLREAGINVTLAEMADQLIAPIDYDLACDVHRHVESKGVSLMLGTTVCAVEEPAGKNGALRIKLAAPDGTITGEITADMLVCAVGVRPETAIAKEAGLKINPRGAIIVDERMRTSAPDVYAVGDAVEVVDFVTGTPAYVPLAGPANKQGRIAADNVCGLDSVYRGTQGSSIVKVFDMTVAATGINEKTAKRLGLDYDKSYTYSASHAGYYPGAVNMSVKTIFEKGSGRILGAQIVGFDGCDKRCDVFAVAIRAGMTAKQLTELELCYAPPYSSAKDPVNMAGYVIENLLEGRVKNFHWHDVAGLQKAGGVTLLDTRTPPEYENGHIDGFINIPLDSLRARLGELDHSKPVYVTCQVGLRGYVAARILSQNGFDAYNLSGGYRLYNSILGPRKPRQPKIELDTETQRPLAMSSANSAPETAENVIKIDACGLQCPGPIVKLSAALKAASDGDIICIKTTDPAFAGDIEGFCRRTGNLFLGIESARGVSTAKVRKMTAAPLSCAAADASGGNNKNIIVFSGDLDKAIASFIIATAAAAMGRKVSMFFTFWGLNVLRRHEKVGVKKDFMSRMFGAMMPRGSRRLPLSKMNMGGMGAKMIRSVMKKKNVDSLEELIKQAQAAGVELIACSMSMDVMGITPGELLDGVKLSGAAAMLANAEESDMSLFI